MIAVGVITQVMPPKKSKSVVPQPEPKLKKVPSGPVREKTRTINKLISSVGKVLQKNGYSGLTVGNIAKEAKVDKKLIYLYFGNVTTLIETFINQRDFWDRAEKGVLEETLNNSEPITQQQVTAFLLSQYERLYKDKLLQKMVLWELSEDLQVLGNVVGIREKISSELFKSLGEKFENDGIDVRALLALQIAGINHLVLDAKVSSNSFYGIDINTDEGKQRISNALKYLIELLYSQVKDHG